MENGPLTLEYLNKFVDSAVKANLSGIQMLDHTHRFFEFSELYEDVKNISPYQEKWLKTKIKDNLIDFINLAEEAKKQNYPIDVKFGLEVCYTSKNEELIRSILKDYKFDFMVGAVHSVNSILYDMQGFSRELLWDKYDANDIYKEYYSEIIKLMKSKLFTQVAHPDTIKLFNIYPDYDLTPTYNEIADLALANDLYVENNFGCHYRYHHKDPGLSAEFKQILLDKNVKIMLCSDAHVPEHVGKHFDLW